MDIKKIRKTISYSLGLVAIHFFSAVIKITPRSCIYWLARTIGTLGYHFAGRQRGIALDSLRMAFGTEKSSAQIKDIAKACFTNMAKSGVELIYLMDKPHVLKKRVELENKQYLDAALARGKGVILVSAHFGNFPLLLGRLSVEGYKTGGIMRPMRDARTEKLFLEKRDRYHIRTIYSQPRKDCVDTTIRSLRNNEIVFIPLDQNFGTSGVFVEFFGRKAATATGPIVFARRTRAAVIACFIIRQPDDTHTIVFEPPLELKEGSTDQEAIAINVQRLTTVIETYIRRYPQEWGWIHRRWKSRPQEENAQSVVSR